MKNKEEIIAATALLISTGAAIASLGIALHVNNKKEDYKLRKEIIADCLEMVGDKKEMTGAYRYCSNQITTYKVFRF